MAAAGGDLEHYIGQEAGDAAANAYFSSRTYNQARGYLYYDTVASGLKIWDGTSWLDLTAAAGGGSPWTESGGILYPSTPGTDDVVVGANAMFGAERFRVAGDARIDSGTLGIRDDPSSAIVVNIEDDLSTTAATAGVFVEGSAAVTNTKASWKGYVSQLSLSSAGTITDVVGFDSDLALTVAAGTLTEAASFHGDVSIGFAGASIGTYRGVHLENTSTVGTVTTAYGIDIEDQDQGSTTVYGLRIRDQGGTTAYGIYQDGSDDLNVLLGDVAVGTTAMSAGEHLRVHCSESSGSPAGVLSSLDTGGSLGSWYGFRVNADVNTGHTVTTSYGIFIDDFTGDGAITTAYGIYIGDMGAEPTVTNNWGVYQSDGGASNYLAGRLAVATTTFSGSEELRVAGGAYFDSDITIGTATSQGDITISDPYDTGTRSGVEIELAKTLTGSGTLWRGVHVDPSVNAGTLASLYYFACDSPIGAGTITNIYGLIIPALKTGPASGATTARAISQGGDDDTNYFAGKTGFGNTFADANSQIAIERLTEGTIGTTESALQVVYQHSGTSGTLTIGRAITAQMSVGSGETIATAEAFVLRSPTGSGTITNSYGIYIEDQDTGPASAGWGIYQVGSTSRNYFAAVVGTKNAAPSSSYGIDDGGGVNTSDAFYVDGTQVVGNQQSAIASVTASGSDSDAVARGKVNEILAALRAHGLIDT